MSGLTRDGAVRFVQQGLAWREDKSDEIVQMFDLVQEELERGMSLPWFIGIRDVPVVGLEAGNFRAFLPTNFIREWDEGGVYWAEPGVNYLNGPRKFLVKRSWEWMQQWEQSAGFGNEVRSGNPRWYSLGVNVIRVLPVPASGGWTVYMDYYAKQPPMSALAPGQQNKWLENASMLLCSHCGLRMAEDLEHTTAAQKFQTRLAAAQARLLAEIVEREYANREYVMGNQA